MISIPKPVRRKDPELLAWIRQQPCLLWGIPEPDCGGMLDVVKKRYASEACHVKSRGAGGDDVQNVVPLCGKHHQEQHRIGIKSFQKRWHINLSAIAKAYDRRFRREVA